MQRPTQQPTQPTQSALAFDAQTTQYRGQNASTLMRLSQLSYCPASDLETIVKNQWRFSKFEYFHLHDTEAYAVADDEKIILVFRGTDNLSNWLNNFDIDLTGGPFKGRVHEGFERILNYAWKPIQIQLNAWKAEARQASKPAPSLWVTGHSLGAALATLAVAKLREKDQPVHGLYTFGSPRVGDRDFAANFEANFKSRIFRFVNRNDLVTRVPPRTLGYSHVGQLYYIDQQGQLQTDPSYWYQFLDGIKVRIEDLFDLDLSSTENHAIASYVQAVTDISNQVVV